MRTDEERIAELESELAAANERIKELESNESNLNDEIRDLRDDRDSYKKSSDEYESALESAKAGIEDLYEKHG
jgi:predicted nuclease with TOPRIM domain